jgi:hypothetical protein
MEGPLATPKRHHVVPVAYLKHFADEGLLVAHPRKGLPHKVTVRNAAVHTNFYRDWAATKANDQGVVERFLAQHVEGRAARWLKHAADGDLPEDPEDRVALDRFLAFQLVRTPSFRRLCREIGEHLTPVLLAGEVVKRVRAANPEMTFEETRAIHAQACHRFQGMSIDGDSRSLLRVMLRKAAELTDTIGALQLLLLSSETPVLLTSDAPAVAWSPTHPADGFRGLMPDDGQIFLPVTPRVLLLATGTPQLGSGRLVAELASCVNGLLAARCERYLYRHPAMPWPTDVVLPPTPAATAAPSVRLRPGTGDQTFPAQYPEVADSVIAELIEQLGGVDIVE